MDRKKVLELIHSMDAEIIYANKKVIEIGSSDGYHIITFEFDKGHLTGIICG